MSIRTVSTLATILGLACAASAKKEPEHPRPRGNEAAYIQMFSSVEVDIKATGVGADPASAEADIAKVALQFVLFRWESKLVSTAEEESRVQPLLDSIYSNPLQYVTWKADKVVSTRRVEDDFQITRVVRIQKGNLQAYLERAGALASRKQLTKGAGNMEIAVMPIVPAGVNPLDVLDRDGLSKVCQASITAYLRNRQYKVKDLKRAAEIMAHNQAKNRVEAGPAQSPTSQLNKAADADIYLRFEGSLIEKAEGKKVSLTLAAIDATTLETIGTERGSSQYRPDAVYQDLVEEATKDAIDRMLQQVNNYWKESTKDGLCYKINVHIPAGMPSDRVRPMSKALRKFFRENFVDAQQDNVDETVEEYTVHVDPSKFSGAPEIFDALEESVRVPGLALEPAPGNRRILEIIVTAK